MRTLVVILVTAAVTAVVALALVYLPERSRLIEARSALTEAEAGLAEARALLAVHALHDEVLELLDETKDPAAHDRAMARSTGFFDLVRAEMFRTGSRELKAAFSEVLSRRDEVTAALARRDPVVRAPLEEIRRSLHPLLRAPAARPATPPALAPAPAATSPEGAAAPPGPPR